MVRVSKILMMEHEFLSLCKLLRKERIGKFEIRLVSIVRCSRQKIYHKLFTETLT